MNFAEITFISIIVIIVAFYLVTIRPAQQEQKRQQQTIRDLKVGDEVVTAGGFLGRVKEIHTPEQGAVQIVLDVGNGTEIRALTSAIARKLTEADRPAESSEEKAKGA